MPGRSHRHRHLSLADGRDPANLLQTGGPQAIAAAVHNRTPLGEVMLDQLLRTAGHWSDPKVRQQIVEQAARILAGYTVARNAELQNHTRRRLPTKHPAPAPTISPAGAESLTPAYHRDIPPPGRGFSGPPR